MSALGQFKRLLLGKPIATKHAHHERLPKRIALPVFASDALSSIAYASEEIMIVFQGASLALLSLTFNVAIAICLLIFMVSISYVRTIYAYPTGGGTYIVARSNLGPRAGTVAGAAMLIDYILTVAVSMSSGIAAIVSLAPATKPYVVPMCVLAIAVVMLANLRGAKESGTLFAVPTYTFVAIVLGMVLWGAFFMPAAQVPAPIANAQSNPTDLTQMAFIFLVMRAFASGCTALTGIEAIADGAPAFKEPVHKNASVTLIVMACLLSAMFIGTSLLGEKFHLIPMSYANSNGQEFKTVLAQMGTHVFGDGSPLFWILQIATALILILAANTAFADFPRLSSFIARDGYLPRQLGTLGDRLVFQNGIIVLAGLAMALVIIFKGDTHALVPLYATGVFLGFTLSQFGMVQHQRLHGGKLGGIALSAVGGTVTGIVCLVIFITKFSHGAYLIFIAMGVLLFIFSRIRRHYDYLARELTLSTDEAIPAVKTTVLLLIPRLHRGVLQAIGYARSMTEDVRALHVTLDPKSAEAIKLEWSKFGADIPLVILESPFRSLITPIIEYIDEALSEDPNMYITVIVPQAVPKYWWHSALHSNVAVPLKLALASKKNVVVTNVRYFLK